MMPILAIFFSMTIGSLAAAGVACGVMDLQYTIYWHQFFHMVDPIDITHCLVKSAAFGLVLTWMAVFFFGFRAHGGALAVGKATRSTVVISCLSILLCDGFDHFNTAIWIKKA